MFSLKTYLTALVLLLSTAPTFAQNSGHDCCAVHFMRDVKHIQFDTASFVVRDTVVAGKLFTVYRACEAGMTVFGNVNEKHKPHGFWRFETGGSGENGPLFGEFKHGKVHGRWIHGAYISVYENGKRKTSMRVSTTSR